MKKVKLDIRLIRPRILAVLIVVLLALGGAVGSVSAELTGTEGKGIAVKDMNPAKGAADMDTNAEVSVDDNLSTGLTSGGSTVAGTVYAADATEAVTLAEWNFGDKNAVADSGIEANIGRELFIAKRQSSGTITETKHSSYTDWPKSSLNYAAYSNSWSPSSSTRALYWTVGFTTLGYRDLTVSSDQVSAADSSGTRAGPRDFMLQYSLDKQNWVDVAEITLNHDQYVTTTAGLPEEAENQNIVYLRWLNTSDKSTLDAPYDTTTSIGPNYIDNISVTGRVIGEEPLDVVEKSPAPYPGLCGLDAEVSVAFNRDISVTDEVYGIYISDSTLKPISGVSYAVSGHKLIITHPRFEPDEYYLIHIPAGAVADASDPGAKFPSEIQWHIMTEDVDAYPPAIQSKSPEGGAGDVELNATIKAAYNEPLVQGSNFQGIAVKDAAGDDVNATVEISDKEIVINGDSELIFKNGSSYVVSIPAGAVKDAAGNETQTEVTWSFTTKEMDLQPPSASSKEPEGSAVPGAAVSVTFGEAVMEGDGFYGISIKDASGQSVPDLSASIEDSKLFIAHAAFEIGKTYTVTIPAGAVRDLSGNPLESPISWDFAVKEAVAEQYNTYFGQLHSHTNVSDGAGTPDEAYAWARDQGKADFFAVTDHSNSFDNEFGSENIDNWEDSTSSEWKLLHSTADKYNKDGEFVAVAGYEMTWSNTNIGHMNTFNTPWFMSRDNGISLQGYYDKIKQYPQSINQFNHPGTTFGYFEQFGRYSSEVDAVIQLIEVGNGDGPVGGAGYFPSYEYYTMALDKGWHLAPSNNQDNHQKKWITANDARTVVLAHELTRDAVFDAIRNLRVYATEDKNLQISYYVNDKVMGASIGQAGNLNFDIHVEDPDGSDSIDSISIISDGGVAAASKSFDAGAADWEFSLPNNYSYYYVKVLEKDGDIAVTAPVFSDTLIPVGISSLKASRNPTTPGSEIDLEAVVYNNSENDINSVRVEFYADDTEIGEQTIAAVSGGGTGSAVVKWTPAQTGDCLVKAVALFNVGGTEKESVATTTVKVLDSGSIKHAVIDGGHYNAYITGNYSGGYTELKELLDANNFITDVNLDALTAEDLAEANVLILSDPGSTDDSYTKKSLYTAEELAAIKNFVNAGGSVIVASTADYGEKSKGITGDYQSAAQNNKVLEAVGSNMRFNDDELYDTTDNVGGMAYKLDFGDYITPGKYGLITGDITSQKFRVYSSSSVIAKSGGSQENIDWLVNLHSTTTSYDSDGSGDSSHPAPGNFHVIGAEQLENGGKVVAAGATFFSNFEFDDTLDSTLANREIMLNMLNWMAGGDTPEKLSISEARKDADNDGVPDRLGEELAIEGIVASESTAITDKYGRNNAFFDVIYVYDDTGGLTVFKVSSREIPVGAKVRITGAVDQYLGDTELQAADESSDVTILDMGPARVRPKSMSTGDSMKEENEGWLVKIQGTVTGMEENALYINDGSGAARVFVDGYIGDGTGNADRLGKWDSSIKEGDTVTAMGFASQDTSGHRLRVRNTAEIGGILAVPAPVLNEDTTNNIPGVPVEITFADNSDWRASVTAVKVDGTAVESGKINITEGRIQIDGSVFTQAKKCEITVTAENYADATVQQTINEGQILSPPGLHSDDTGNNTGKDIEITFTDDAAWRSSISEVGVDGAVLAASKYTVSAGKITISGSVFVTAKQYSIVVKATGYNDAGIVQSITGKPKAVIDGGHSNIYVSGDYSNKGTGMKAVLDEKGFEYTVNSDALTEADLSGAGLLIITDPGPSSKLTADELTAVNNFVKAGGTLVITSKADYGDASGEYQNSAQGNSVLEAIGSNMRFNDDEVVDSSQYTVYFSNYDIPAGSASSKYEIVKPENTSQQFRMYSASTVYLKEAGSDAAIDWMVRPNAITSYLDADKKGDRITPPDGKLHMLGAELLSSGGKVMAAGCTFFSDYEIVGADYSNRSILGNIFDWALKDENPVQEAPGLVVKNEGYRLGEDVDITFTDDEAWRNAITGIKAGDKVLESTEFTVAAGVIKIARDVFDSAGTYSITITADGYEDAAAAVQVIKVGEPVYVVTPEDDANYTTGVDENGIKMMVVNQNVVGFKYFRVSTACVQPHDGEETLVFALYRNGFMPSLVSVQADLDGSVNGGTAGFNVQAGDVIKVYVVDELSNQEDSNPVVLQ